MQSVTDAAASQGSPSRELILISVLGTQLRLHMYTPPRGVRTRCAPSCTVVSTIDCIACQMRELRSTITLQDSMLQIGKYDAENGMITATSLVAQPWTWNNRFKFHMKKTVNLGALL